LFIAAALSLLTTLNLPYQGEEAIYTITSMEMAFYREWITPTLYGVNYGRPPFFNWLLLPFGFYFGWQPILIIARLITFFLTMSTAMGLMWFVRRIFHHRALAIVVGLVYLSGDVLFRRGWLAYADPLFSFFVFGAMAFLWIAVLEKNRLFLLLSLFAVIAAFLTKAYTSYVFYAGTWFILALSRENRKFLFSKSSLLLHGMAFIFPIIWYLKVSEGAHGSAMVSDITARFQLSNLFSYMLKIVFFPIDIFLRWLPVSGLLLYFGWGKINQAIFKAIQDPKILILFGIILINLLPYWIAPEARIRYIMPLYPFIAIGLAYGILTLEAKKLKSIFWVFVVIIGARFGLGLWGFPYYEKHYRGNYENIAADILSIVKEEPLYADDDNAPGINITAIIDAKLLPKAILVRPPIDKPSGYLLSKKMGVKNTTLKKIYYLGRHPLYLLKRTD
jgi:4-amino-4-deoxy-L-arabinose transferase-like glycosyltransferase